MTISYNRSKVETARKDARRWGMHFPAEGLHGDNIEITHGVAEDPNPTRRGRPQLVAVNLRHDVLENERARGRISLAAYMAGRRYQGTWEEHRDTGPFCGERISLSHVVNDWPMIIGIDRARRKVEIQENAKQLLGKDRERLMNKILNENRGIAEAAADGGYMNTKQRYYVGETFRQSLEILGKAWFCS